MALTQEAIAILELCVYIPIVPLALLIVFRHGWHRQLGWIYLVTFCTIRIVGAGFRIASTKNPDDSTDLEASSILQSIGLSPLLLASLGLLKRITDEVSEHVPSDPESFRNVAMAALVSKAGVLHRVTKPATATSRRSRIIQLAQLPTMVALILCIVGGIDEASSSISEQASGRTLFKAGIAIFVVIYALLFLLAAFTARDVGNAPRGEKKIYFAVLAALPLIAVRLLWSILAVFTTMQEFSLATGNPVIQLCMAVLEEIVVIIMYTLAGLAVLPASKWDTSEWGR